MYSVWISLAAKLLPFIIVLLLFYLIRQILSPKKSFYDFIIGDSGTYSLSRLQIVAWVYIIISVQICIMISLMLINFEYVYSYTFLLPEEVLFLLGLSSASYISVKSITINEIVKKQEAQIKVRNKADIISGKNGLDFTRFQFLIWTIIAIFIYLLHCNNYINILLSAKDLTEIHLYLNVDYSELPTVDWSLIVLMGLSQGTYVGKKLVLRLTILKKTIWLNY